MLRKYISMSTLQGKEGEGRHKGEGNHIFKEKNTEKQRQKKEERTGFVQPNIGQSQLPFLVEKCLRNIYYS